MAGPKDDTPRPDPREEIARAIDEGQPVGEGPDQGEADAPAEPKQRRKPASGRKGSAGAKGRAKGKTAASEPNGEAAEASGTTKRRRPPLRDSLMSLTEDCDLWVTPDAEAFATVPMQGHRQHWPVKSENYRRWLASRAYARDAIVPTASAIEDCLRVLEAKAASEGRLQEAWVRCGQKNGKLYVDLCNESWQAIEIDTKGWRIVSGNHLPFTRYKAMRPLCEPEAGSEISELRRFANVATDDDFTLVVAWLVAALRSTGPFPILIVNGEQGSGKSTFCRLLRTLVDPNAAPIRSAPREDRDLIISAGNSHVICMDNLSKVESWLSDALCRLATGGGFSTRKLQSDKDETIFMATKPAVLNGITSLSDRADLADRAVTIRLRTIEEDERRPEDEFWLDWDETAPRVLGCLLDALSAALRNLPTTRLERSPRLADFAKLMVAAEPGLGWEPGTFLDAYGGNRKQVFDENFESDVVAVAIVNFVEPRPYGFEGTASELLTALNDLTPEAVKTLRSWPKAAPALSARLERAAPVLRQKGFRFERRHSGARTITIRAVAAQGGA